MSTDISMISHKPSVCGTDTSFLSLASSAQSEAPSSQTLAFIYDIPKDQGYTSAELTLILKGLGYKCDVQLKKKENLTNPFLSAVVKFTSVA